LRPQAFAVAQWVISGGKVEIRSSKVHLSSLYYFSFKKWAYSRMLRCLAKTRFVISVYPVFRYCLPWFARMYFTYHIGYYLLSSHWLKNVSGSMAGMLNLGI
jgi:hypothetical protein